MAFRPPDFNLLANLWTCDGTPTPSDGGADYLNVPCQKYIASRAAWPVSPPWANGFFLQYVPPVQLRFARTDPFDQPWPDWKVTIAEVPAGSGQYYRLVWNDIQHEGFPNEYALFAAAQCDPTGIVTPPAGSTLPVGIGADPCGNIPPQDDIKPNIPGGLNCCSGGTPGAGFLDTFTDTAGTQLVDHTADTGETWSCTDASGIIVTMTGDGIYQQHTDSGNTAAVADYTGSADGVTTMNFHTPDPLGNGVKIGCIIRAVDTANFVLCYIDDDGTHVSVLKIATVTSGVISDIASSGTDSLSTDTEYVITVTQSGDSIDVALSQSGTDILTVSTSDATFDTATGLGVWFFVDTDYPSVAVGQLQKV